MIRKIFIKNYRIFDALSLEMNGGLNIIVGDNEAGKSTILEAVNLALTKRLNGRSIENELTPYLFNKEANDAYIKSLQNGAILPEILIELYFDDVPELRSFRGSMNFHKEDCIGIKLAIVFDEDFRGDYAKFLDKRDDVKLVPTEYYKVDWLSFANNPITQRALPIAPAYIDATTIRLQSGTDYYLQDIIRNDLDEKERVDLSIAYRKLKEEFSGQDSIKGINQKLTSKKGAITDKDLTISIDISQKSNWETNLIPHLDELPFQLIGKGEQNALKIMLALERKAGKSDIILIEEPENHLSFSSMNLLIAKINEKCEGKQIFVTTHSAYVLNKLGLENLLLLHANETIRLKYLPPDTQNYFKKLSGYDTLRLILSKRSILVEGPSDELVIQKAYKLKHQKMPIQNGVDVINVRGLSFIRFLDIAKELKKEIAVVTDNDGDHASVDEKYKSFKDNTFISVYRSGDDSAKTLEPQMIKVNSFELLNKVFGKTFNNDQDLEKWMIANKTEWALRILETTENIKFPDYVDRAVTKK